MKNSQQVLNMLNTGVVAVLTPAKERLVHPLKDSWCRINFVHDKKSSVLRSGKRGGQATRPPNMIHCVGHVSFKKLHIMMGKCAETPSCINHMSLDGEQNSLQLTVKLLF